MNTKLKRHVIVKGICVSILLSLSFSVFAQDGDEAKKNALLSAYPGLFSFEGNELVWKDGTRMIWDDGKTKTPEQLAADPDLQDMFTDVYPLAKHGALVPAKNFDPGRIRNEAFLKKLYGKTSNEVEKNVVAVKWLPKLGKNKFRVTTLFDIDTRIEQISAEIEALPKNFQKYVLNPSGGFNWRFVAGTKQLSVHSFAVAVDINTDFSDYWYWEDSSGKNIPYKNRIPLEIVEIFEKHGFIWGGRWYHYDTMHFEYRPELLIYSN